MEIKDLLYLCFIVSFFLKLHGGVVKENVLISVIASFRCPKKTKKLTEV